MSHLADREFVRSQYADASCFDARVQLYRYAQAEEPWPAWVKRRLRLARGERVLELGCGPGNLWRARGGLPPGLRVTLTDLSPGMAEEARRRIEDVETPFTYTSCDAQLLPFPDERFDVVIANHMLYHVPDRARALAEIQRVVVRGGRVYIGTNEWTHLTELRELCERFGLDSEMRPVGRDPALFDLEDAAAALQPLFDPVRLFRRTDALEVEETQPFMDYLGSFSQMTPENDRARERIRAHVERHIALLGSLHISISIGLFEAIKS
jgi:SAM-dependent methyltransferase